VRARERALVGVQASLLLAAALAGALLSEADDWDSIALFGLLLGLACASELFRLRTKRFFISASFLAIVLAMTLLGPTPAAVIGVSVMLVNVATRRTGWRATLNNLSTYAVFALVGGAVFEALGGPGLHSDDKAGYVALIVAVFLAMNLLNFLLIAVDIAVVDGQPVHRSLLSIYLPVMPVELAVATLTAGAALIYQEQGLVAIGLLTVVASLFQYLLSTALAAMDRKEQLEGRTRQLAALQVGLITTVLQTLSLRDKHTARHSAAVARYSREVARALGLTERDQEIVHTAGLLHDIGKFIFPDSILLADTELTHHDWAIVRRHPEQGAQLVRRIEGYGPVADLIMAHHERLDGQGYPLGLRGEEIPLGSRIISVADTYDVLTARDSYRDPVSPDEAIEELRRMAGSQLDAELVDVFIELVRDRSLKFRHADDVDFEQELNFERRVQDYAEPRAGVA
jgi:putative nucleotidyltransferase with HDIG domain